ncbi:type IX secretion system outer membrane channel protein PorV [Porphyromonas sp. COT-290 OH860]|uniref:type IX secretion system outer membrane channel protein PorV n=1 Tax=Porphyromonas sp. COT-290 OH860 TaxID=1515615 RepID=UPI00052C9437|nr:type IX secretion system outer membrane channel protein PorV [Porphyromonas sp. COT-290 OH860]KGN84268.1 membrane protein [Porphyromonas sp. COT-290 OH860]
MKHISLALLTTLGLTMGLNAHAQQSEQPINPVVTAVPSLQITPDARAAGLGDIGVSTTADPYAQYWNPAKYAFASSKAAFSMSYTPWLSQLVDDIALMQAVGYYKIGSEDNQALGASLRYFTMGKFVKFDALGTNIGEAHPNEFAVDLSYSLKLSPEFSMAVGLRYIYSDQNVDKQYPAGSAFAADLAGYMNKYIMLAGAESLWKVGFNLKNLGSKISFDDGASNSFIPANLGLGTGILYPIDEYNMISFNVEANKLLVPTRPLRTEGMTKEEENKLYDDYRNTSSVSGIFKSFTDAPGGFSEEMKEVRWSFGAEYSYNDQFFLRAGYSYLHPTKGNLQGFTAGAGFKMSAFRIDASYLMSTVQNNPLDQTLRFSLAFDMEGLRNLFR